MCVVVCVCVSVCVRVWVLQYYLFICALMSLCATATAKALVVSELLVAKLAQSQDPLPI